jgi:hypothetical protein
MKLEEAHKETVNPFVVVYVANDIHDLFNGSIF